MQPDATRSALRATVIVPAYQEEAVIARALAPIQPLAASGEIEIIVVCNGCTDRTAEVARAAAPAARVLETGIAGKTRALNLGEAAALAPVCLYLDADLGVSPADIRHLVAAIEGGAVAACGLMRVEASRSSWMVRAFYRVWSANPYLGQGKFGGLFALSPAGRARVHPLPDLTSDDEYVRRRFSPDERVVVEECVFVMRAPRTLRDLVRIRRRSIRGARALDRLGLRAAEPTGGRSATDTLARIWRHPWLWPATIIYVGVALHVRLSLALENPATAPRWERDESSRANDLVTAGATR